MTKPGSAAALELIGIDKSFGTTHANRNISIAFQPGSIHGLIGENGAGKSTLMRIAYGLERPDQGTIAVSGRVTPMNGPQAAIAAGIGMVHQHFMLVDRFTVLENMVLGAEPGWDIRAAHARARAFLAEVARDYGLTLPADARIRDLTIGDRQSVEILKALYRDARILILDEPTSVLTPFQSERLFAMLRRLRDDGRTIVFITHKLSEIIALTDRITVLRQGEVAGEMATAATNPDALAQLMIGSPVDLAHTDDGAQTGETLLETRNLTILDRRKVRRVDSVDLTVRAGEIVAIAGVAGNGQSELLQALAGMLPIESGNVLWRGAELARRQRDPAALRRLGIAHVPEDPRRYGSIGDVSIAENSILGHHARPPAARNGVLDRRRIAADCRAQMGSYDIRPPDPAMRTASLSGGNLQKLVLAREIDHEPLLLLIGEPTQGVDIGAVAAIHARLMGLRARGKGILLVTSDLDEVRRLADRILVMSAGKIVGEVSPESATDHTLGLLMGGVGSDGAEARP